MLQALVILFFVSSTVAGRGGGRVGSHRSYPSHGYPHSTGLSGTVTSHQLQTYQQNNVNIHKTDVHSYPSHGYPHSTGLSGAVTSHQTHKTYQQNNVQHSHQTEVHNHYYYNPPQQIHYGTGYHPVYQSSPPVYVYEYRDSGSRFNNLLTGLALYNLGRMSASHSHYETREYRSNPGEICKLGISKTNGDYEETRIDCKLMSSFIWEAEKRTEQNVVSAKTVTTIVNVTQVSNVTRNDNDKNSTVITTVSVQNKTVVDALTVKGPSIKVTQGMNCFMIRISRDSSILKKTVECGLLQSYAQNSLYYNGSGRFRPIISILLPIFLTETVCYASDIW